MRTRTPRALLCVLHPKLSSRREARASRRQRHTGTDRREMPQLCSWGELEGDRHHSTLRITILRMTGLEVPKLPHCNYAANVEETSGSMNISQIKSYFSQGKCLFLVQNSFENLTVRSERFYRARFGAVTVARSAQPPVQVSFQLSS